MGAFFAALVLYPFCMLGAYLVMYPIVLLFDKFGDRIDKYIPSNLSIFLYITLVISLGLFLDFYITKNYFAL